MTRQPEDAAFTAMTLDILKNVLGKADNPKELGRYLTEEIRGLTGASCVLLIQYPGDASGLTHRILNIDPLRKREWAESKEANLVYEIVHQLTATQLWRAGDTSEAAALLQKEGYDLSLIVPLYTGTLRVGAMLMLGMPDETHLSSVVNMVTTLSTIVALVLSNSFLYEKQEQIIRERTSELLKKSEESRITLLGILEDEKMMKEALLKSESLLEQTQEITGVGGWEYDAATQKINWTKEVYRIYEVDNDYNPSNVDHNIEFYAPGDREIVNQAFYRAIKTGESFDLEVQFTGARGTHKWIRTTAVTEGISGKVARVFGYIMDITQRKNAEVEREQFFKFFQISSDIMVIADPNGAFKKVNPATSDILGYSEKELISKPYIDFVHPDDKQSTLDEMARQIKEGSSLNFENRYVCKDGTLLCLSWRANYNKDERITYAAARDITERKKADEEIRRLNTKLEERVIERTAQLEAANKELQAFSYSVSHDLRAPLRSIDGFSQALAQDYQDKFDETGRDYINRVRNSVKKMSDLIEAMLSLSRLTRGEIKYETVDLSTIAQKISKELIAREPGRKVDFIIQENVKTNGDAQMLSIVLDNLLGNSWKFTSRHPTAKIEFGEKEIEGRTAYFVRDDGAGFEQEYAGKLFTAFQRLHTPEQFPGIGIGLATVQRILHRHGGKVWAQGDVEKGATFYFTLSGG